METGTKISAGAHVALLGWLLVGPIFRAEPLPMNVQEVSVISGADFAAMTAPRGAPDAVTDVALPQVSDPEVSPQPAPLEEATPAPLAPPIQQPEPDAPPSPPVVEDTPAPTPEPTPEPEDAAPQQADRIAAEPVDAPDPDATPDPEPSEEVTEDAGDIVAQEPQEATAPPETTTEIVTEADEPKTAPTRSMRPPARRPNPPVTQTAQTPQTPQPAPETSDATSDATADAIASAVAQAAQPDVPLGPPLTGGELDGLRVAVGKCWNVGALSTEAQETTVKVLVSVARDGKPDVSSIRMVAFEGGSQAAAKRVFDTARRAIIRCGVNGFPLPVEKYGQWREIEMKFNPEGMFW